MSDSERIRISEYFTQTIHIESRPVDPQLYHGQKQGEPRRYVWVRAMENIGKTVDVDLFTWLSVCESRWYEYAANCSKLFGKRLIYMVFEIISMFGYFKEFSWKIEI